VTAGARVFSRIVAAVDFSDSSQTALKEAIALCRQYGAALTAVHVVEPVPTYAESGIPGLDADIEREAAYGYLKGLIERLAPGFQAEQVVLIGHAGKGVLGTAASAKADLIVAGVHGRNAMDLMFFGSTANRLVREAVCPVLTLKS
jgi:nucleotide-binding universal stress UspA family protein